MIDTKNTMERITQVTGGIGNWFRAAANRYIDFIT